MNVIGGTMELFYVDRDYVRKYTITKVNDSITGSITPVMPLKEFLSKHLGVDFIG